MRAMAQGVYPQCVTVAFREPVSYREASPLCTEATLAADAAFAYRPRKSSADRLVEALKAKSPDAARLDAIDWNRPYVSIGGSSAYKRQTQRFNDLRRAYRALIGDLLVLRQVVVTASRVPDDAILGPVASALGLPYLGLLTLVQLCVDVLGGADLYLGARWHPSVMALAGGTPIIEWTANSRHKSAGIVEIAELEQPEIPSLELSANRSQIIDLAERRLAAGADLRERLSVTIEPFAATASDNVRYLAKTAQSVSSADPATTAGAG